MGPSDLTPFRPLRPPGRASLSLGRLRPYTFGYFPSSDSGTGRTTFVRGGLWGWVGVYVSGRGQCACVCAGAVCVRVTRHEDVCVCVCVCTWEGEEVLECV